MRDVYYRAVVGLGFLIGFVFIILGVLDILSPFPTIGGVIMSLGGSLGAWIDWRQKHDTR